MKDDILEAWEEGRRQRWKDIEHAAQGVLVERSQWTSMRNTRFEPERRQRYYDALAALQNALDAPEAPIGRTQDIHAAATAKDVTPRVKALL